MSVRGYWYGDRVKRSKPAWKKALVGAVVLLVLAVVGGLLYTYLSPEYKVKPGTGKITGGGGMREPAKQNPNARASVAVQSMTTPLAPGENAALTVRTNQGGTCKITKLEYGTMPATDSGLSEKKADKYGMVSWSWTIPANAPEGNWDVRILCTNTNNGMTAEGKADFVVSKAAAVPVDLGTP